MASLLSQVGSFGRAFSETEDRSGMEILDLSSFRYRDIRRFIPATAFRSYQVRSDETGSPDMISYRVYGTHDYWWVICIINGVTDPFSQFPAGTVLQLPSRFSIEQYLSFRNTTRDDRTENRRVPLN